jgi:hypothetical protein
LHLLLSNQRRYQIRSPADVPALPPVAAGALQLLPPAAYAHQPATSFNIKFAGQAPSKVCLLPWLPCTLLCLLECLIFVTVDPTGQTLAALDS